MIEVLEAIVNVIDHFKLCTSTNVSLHSLAPQPCPEYSVSGNYIDSSYEERRYITVYQISICLGNTYGDLCYSPYFTDDVADSLCRSITYDEYSGK